MNFLNLLRLTLEQKTFIVDTYARNPNFMDIKRKLRQSFGISPTWTTIFHRGDMQWKPGFGNVKELCLALNSSTPNISEHLCDSRRAHFRLDVRAWFDEHFPGKWMGRGGPIAWPPRSPYLNPMDFCVGYNEG